MKQLINNWRHPLTKYGMIVARLAVIALLAFVVGTIVSLQRDNKDILVHIKGQQDVSDQAVQALKDDNAQQTVILCTLILSNNVSVQPEDASKIEAICKEKITQSQDPKAAASDGGAVDFQMLNNADPTPQQEMTVVGGTNDAKPSPPPQANQNVIQRVITKVKGLL